VVGVAFTAVVAVVPGCSGAPPHPTAASNGMIAKHMSKSSRRIEPPPMGGVAT
jgi:hypothetical protein